jgi:hypothetical protein
MIRVQDHHPALLVLRAASQGGHPVAMGVERWLDGLSHFGTILYLN